MPAEKPDSEEPIIAHHNWLSHRFYKGHSLIYGTAIILWILAVAFIPGDWSLFWPVMIWTIGYMTHFLIYKGMHVEENWVTKRVERLTDEAKDLSHIEAIRDDYRGANRRRRPVSDQ